MSVTVVGSIAFDAVKTPFGTREKMLGGSAVHFSLAASFFDTVHVVGPVGDDFGEDEYAVLHARGVDTDDIEHVAGGKTFFWARRVRLGPQRPQDARYAAGRVRGVRTEAVGALAAAPTWCSWPTSSQTSSAKSALSAPTRGSSPWTR